MRSVVILDMLSEKIQSQRSVTSAYSSIPTALGLTTTIESAIMLPDLPAAFHEGSCTGATLKEYFYVLSDDCHDLYRIDIHKIITTSNSNNGAIVPGNWERVDGGDPCLFGSGFSITLNGSQLFVFGGNASTSIRKMYDPRHK